MTVLVDSDILIEVSRGRNAKIISQWLDLARADAAVLYSPNQRGGTVGQRATQRTRCSESSLSRTEMCSDRPRNGSSGVYLRKYRKSHGVEIADALIAACTVANGADLWTRNRKRYPMKNVSFFA